MCSRFFKYTRNNMLLIIHDDGNVSIVERISRPYRGKRRKGMLQQSITPIHPRFRLNACSPVLMPDPDISHCHVYTFIFYRGGFFPSRSFAVGKYPSEWPRPAYRVRSTLNAHNRGVKSSPLRIGAFIIEIRLGALQLGITLSLLPVIRDKNRYKRRGAYSIRAKLAIYGDKCTRLSRSLRHRRYLRIAERVSAGVSIFLSWSELYDPRKRRYASRVARETRARHCWVVRIDMIN